MTETIFKLIDAINCNDISNCYWQIWNLDLGTFTDTFLGTKERIWIKGKYITVYGEGDALDAGIDFESADLALTVNGREGNVKLYFWEV